MPGTWEPTVYISTSGEMYNYINGTKKKLSDPDPAPAQIAKVHLTSLPFPHLLTVIIQAMWEKFWTNFSQPKITEAFPSSKKQKTDTTSSKNKEDHEVEMSMEDPYIYGRCGYDHFKKQG